ncbi:MAG: hypothetical protein AABZ74_07870 [Cyanobacteriota bacterium]
MSLKKFTYFFLLTGLGIIFPLVSFSENVDNKSFKTAVNKKTTTEKASLIGSWKDPQGLFNLIFLSNNELESFQISSLPSLPSSLSSLNESLSLINSFKFIPKFAIECIYI